MDFHWIATALGDVAWISVAFVLGLAARAIGLPPLVGFLVAGFVLNSMGIASGDMLATLSDLGITLLLFTVGLKLDLKMLARPQVWGVTGLHTGIIVASFGLVFFALALLGAPLFSSLSFPQAILLALAFSFSSTVFVVKALEEKGEMASLHGRIAIGILIVQDIIAVAFLGVSSGEWPTMWAVLILLLIPFRFVLHRVLEFAGHGELFVLYGFMLAVGGAELFKLVNMKGDLGALFLGILIANHPKANEMAKTMLGFKDLFLLGFFLSVGMAGALDKQTMWIGLLVTPLVIIKSGLFFTLLTRFRLRARTSLLATANLSNFSEFGLIVGAIGVSHGWLDGRWMVVLAIALSLSFIISSILSRNSQHLYNWRRDAWKKLQHDELTPDDRLIDTKGAKVAIIGMGRVGSGAYDAMKELHGDYVVGIDMDHNVQERQVAKGRDVLQGDPTDADFWDRVQETHMLELVMLALPRLSSSLAVLDQLEECEFTGKVAATAHFPDEVDDLYDAGADTVFNIYTEAGAGFAAHILTQEEETEPSSAS